MVGGGGGSKDAVGRGLHVGKNKRYNEKLRQHDMGGGMVKQCEGLCHVIEIDDVGKYAGQRRHSDDTSSPRSVTIRCCQFPETALNFHRLSAI